MEVLQKVLAKSSSLGIDNTALLSSGGKDQEMKSVEIRLTISHKSLEVLENAKLQIEFCVSRRDLAVFRGYMYG